MIGLEINDAGLLAAGANGELLELEPGTLASPGVALMVDGRLKVGRAAEKHCRRLPRQANHQFWHRLAGDPLQDPAFAGLTNADLAHAHLSSIWQQISPVCDALLVAVPDVCTGQQLELLAGIMHALSMPVRGFVSLPLAALPPDAPAEVLLHLDLGLHRVLLTLMDVGRPAAVIETAAIDNLGLEDLRTAWLQVIADQFVRRTRFDPFHSAETEQTLYDQLPGLLAALESAEDVAVEMTTSTAVHRIRLHRNTLEEALVPLLDAVQREIHLRQHSFLGPHPLGTIYVSHRGSRLPGFCRRMEAATGTRVQPLTEGAAARGLLAFANAFPPRRARPGIPFINRQSGPERPSPPLNTANQQVPGTHLLYRSRGYRVSERPMIIGREIPTGSPGIQIHGRTEGVSRRHCTVVRQVDRLVLTDTSTYGTFVDDVKVAGAITLTVGQIIRVGTPGEQLQVIACSDNDETPVA